MNSTTGLARIIAITSGKGGVGKTFVAANLAAALAQRRKRVLVLDADLGLANLDVILNLYPKATLHDVLTGACSIDDVLLQAPGGFWVMPAASGLVEYSRLTSDVQEELRRIIDELSQRYDFLLLDTGAGISDLVLYTASLAKEVLVIVTPEPASIADAYATIKVLALLQQRNALKLLFNQTTGEAEARRLVQQLQQVTDRFVNAQLAQPVQLEFAGYVPNDGAVRDAARKRELLYLRDARAPASKAIEALARTLATPPRKL